MSWSNVKLIFYREVRDQLRDRRTLFTIAVLPLLLYPLLGMSFLQISQFMQEHPTHIWVIGAAHLPDEPVLIEEGRFSSQLCAAEEQRLLELTVAPTLPAGLTEHHLFQEAEQRIQSGAYDAVVFFPPGFAARLQEFRDSLANSGDDMAEAIEVPEPQVFVNTANDKSRIAYDRVEGVLQRWRDSIVERNLQSRNIPISATRPFDVANRDVSEDLGRRAAVWSKILPFVVLVWALTGAFYPAIDLCAGEKERGTLETLLSSPALRTEIVWGKLLTVIVFSMTTSLLNLASMGLTGTFIMRQLQSLGPTAMPVELGPPPLASVGWLVLALVPISALFSALSLAVATFARSSKEGQYYLMPLLLITLPLMMLPMLPATELNLGTSLIPVTGVMLLLRALIEGQHADALLHAGPVVAVTAVCCLLAIRWAVDQFSNEQVLFRESERWGLGLWMRHLVRDRGDTPTFGEAVLCGVVLLVIGFFASFLAPRDYSWNSFAIATLIRQIALVAAPALLMTIMLTRSPRRTLLLSAPRALSIPAAVLLAAVLQPTAMWLGRGIQWLYPLSEETALQLLPINEMISQAPLAQVLLLLAVTPAICEELAFRGFVLSGLRHMGHKWAAILLGSLFFGLAHGVLQQSLLACAVGVVVGYLAVQTGSLAPCVLFHLTHNGLMVLASRITPDLYTGSEVLQWIMHPAADGSGAFIYHWPVAVLGGLAAIAILRWLHRLPYHAYAEEELQHALDHQSPRPTPA